MTIRVPSRKTMPLMRLVLLAGILGTAVMTPACLKKSASDEDQRLSELRLQGVEEGWTFQVGETSYARQNPNPKNELVRLHNPDADDWRSQADRQARAERASYDERPLPPAWDWRWFGVVTEVRNQSDPNYCGSCWAFGTVAAFEASIMIKSGKRPGLHISEQQLVSCSDHGTCSGGYYAFKFLTKTGANYNTDFPYMGEDVSCKKNAAKHEKASKWDDVGKDSSDPTVEEVKRAIYEHGPVAATISASGAFGNYTGGIYNECNTSGTNHIIALVGWDDKDQVWILKNSHGTDWGEKGFMRIKYKGRSGEKCNSVAQDAAWVEYEPEGGVTPEAH